MSMAMGRLRRQHPTPQPSPAMLALQRLGLEISSSQQSRQPTQRKSHHPSRDLKPPDIDKPLPLESMDGWSLYDTTSSHTHNMYDSAMLLLAPDVVMQARDTTKTLSRSSSVYTTDSTQSSASAATTISNIVELYRNLTSKISVENEDDDGNRDHDNDQFLRNGINFLQPAARKYEVSHILRHRFSHDSLDVQQEDQSSTTSFKSRCAGDGSMTKPSQPPPPHTISSENNKCQFVYSDNSQRHQLRPCSPVSPPSPYERPFSSQLGLQDPPPISPDVHVEDQPTINAWHIHTPDSLAGGSSFEEIARYLDDLNGHINPRWHPYDVPRDTAIEYDESYDQELSYPVIDPTLSPRSGHQAQVIQPEQFVAETLPEEWLPARRSLYQEPADIGIGRPLLSQSQTSPTTTATQIHRSKMAMSSKHRWDRSDYERVLEHAVQRYPSMHSPTDCKASRITNRRNSIAQGVQTIIRKLSTTDHHNTQSDTIRKAREGIPSPSRRAKSDMTISRFDRQLQGASQRLRKKPSRGPEKISESAHKSVENVASNARGSGFWRGLRSSLMFSSSERRREERLEKLKASIVLIGPTTLTAQMNAGVPERKRKTH